mmetsp:Transcript_718/g.1344  ORF Transcript_718/g.1344 Transcript_718/m.1344 type:complete len:800 (-) Transcript_718:13-2412(-)
MTLQRFCFVFALLAARAAAEARGFCTEEHDKTTFMQVNTRLSALKSTGSEVNEDHETQSVQSQVGLASELEPDSGSFPKSLHNLKGMSPRADSADLNEDASMTRLTEDLQQQRPPGIDDSLFQRSAAADEDGSVPLQAAGSDMNEDSLTTRLNAQSRTKSDFNQEPSHFQKMEVPDEYGSFAESARLGAAGSELTEDAFMHVKDSVMPEKPLQTFGAEAAPDEHGSFPQPTDNLNGVPDGLAGLSQRTAPDEYASIPASARSLNAAQLDAAGSEPKQEDASLMVQTNGGSSAAAVLEAAGLSVEGSQQDAGLLAAAMNKDAGMSHASAVETMGMAGQSLEVASHGLQSAQSLADVDASRAAVAEASLKVLTKRGRAAKEAQTVALAQEEHMEETVQRAMQRIRGAASAEKREASAQLTASDYLQSALEDAELMQAQEKERGTQAARAAQLLQDALGSLQRQAEENPDAATVHSLRAALQAQQAVIATESKKLQDAAFLQQSLRRASTAVLNVRAAKDELLDVYKQLKGVQAAWDKRTQWELEAATSLEGVLNDTMSLQQVVEGVITNKTLEASFLQDVTQQVRAAQQRAALAARATQGLATEKQASQAQVESMQEALIAEQKAGREALMAEQQASKEYTKSMRDALLAEERATVQDASSKLQASEAKVDQLSRFVQGAQRESSLRSTQVAALSQVSRSLEVQLGNLAQQLSWFRSMSQDTPPVQPLAMTPPLQGLPLDLPGGMLGTAPALPSASFGFQSPGQSPMQFNNLPPLGGDAAMPAGGYSRGIGQFLDVPLARW